jgi:hypothetical protein
MNFTLERNAFGKLILSNAQGERFEGVVPVRTFPIQAPEEGISLVSLDGLTTSATQRPKHSR